MPKTSHTEITSVRQYEAQSILKNLINPDDENSANWTYTAFFDKVYVRGSKGFTLWSETAPGDLREVIILEID